MMQEGVVSICWLYNDLLDLYGDSGNLLVLTKRLAQIGVEARITRLSISDELDFAPFDMIYVGPGKARNLKRAAEHFCQYKNQVFAAIESGKLFLVTGNARLLFGESYTIEEEGKEPETVDGVGYFSYTGVETGNVFISDVIAKPLYSENAEKTYGFINRTSFIKDNPGPYLFEVLQGAGEDEKQGGSEGSFCRNFFGTWQLGPILVKNPHLVRELLRRLCPVQSAEYDDSLAVTAWQRTIDEFPLKNA